MRCLPCINPWDFRAPSVYVKIERLIYQACRVMFRRFLSLIRCRPGNRHQLEQLHFVWGTCTAHVYIFDTPNVLLKAVLSLAFETR